MRQTDWRAPFMALGAILMAGTATAQLQDYRWERRLLVIVAAEADAQVAEQRRQAADPGFAERDLDVIEVLGSAPPTVNGAPVSDLDAPSIRARYADDAPAFRALLIGKDGGVKLRSDAPIPRDDLYALIDTLPMRRREMQRPNGG